MTLVMLTRIGLSSLFVGACLAGVAPPAAASAGEADATVRETRRVSIGISPAWPWMSAHDATAPLPAVRAGVNLSPHLTLDLTIGRFQYSEFGGWSLVDFGARWFFLEGNLSPYAMARGGAYFVDGDESPDRTYRYATLGGGVEYASDGGFTTWAEVGPALIDGNAGAYASIGLGYRFGTRPK